MGRMRMGGGCEAEGIAMNDGPVESRRIDRVCTFSETILPLFCMFFAHS